jgi:putative ABC transport system permease protein
MKFVLRMAWREMRASWARLLFFFVCVALGVAAIVVLRSVVQNVRTTLTREARSLVGADLVVQSSRPWTDETRRRLDDVLSVSRVLGRTELIETQTMAAAPEGKGTGRVRLVELRGIEPGFPFYGALELQGGQPFSHALVADHGALVPAEFLAELGLAVGDVVRLAGQSFTIRGVVVKDRVQRGGGSIAFGPRVYIDLRDLRATSLLGFGSRAAYQVLLRVDEGEIDRLTRDLRRSFRRETVSVRSWRTLEDRLGRNLTVAENYLSLVGFAIVVLGGIGVWSVTRVIVQQKIRSVAILKCLGASSRQVLGTYVLQVLWLAAAGSGLGVVLAMLAVAAIPTSILEPLGITSARITASAAVQGVVVGLLVSLLFALVPLLDVRRIKPILLLRADTRDTARQRDWQSWLAGTATAILLALVAIWQAGSVKAGLFVSIGFVIVAATLAVASRLLVRATAPLGRSSRFALRHAVISLGRPGNQTRVILMAVGLGCFFILSVRALQANLLHEFSMQLGGNSPDLVLVDVQPDQQEGVRKVVTPYAIEPPRFVPLLRARVVGISGRRVQLENADAVRRHGRLTREYGLTYRDHLQENERVLSGRFWTGPAATPPAPGEPEAEVSIVDEVQREAQVDVGDVMRFDVAGQVLQARVTSVRKVAWDETQNGGFFFVLRPGPAVSRVPHTLVGFVETGANPAARGALQRDLVTAYPNVSSIDVTAILESIRRVVDNATLGITIVGAVTLVGGILILVGAVAMTKFQRLYEAAIYRTLGASTRLVGAMVALEYGVLGLLAGILGAAGALVLSWALAHWLFEIDWRPAPGLLSAGIVITAVAVSIVGLLASIDVLLRKPLGTLRSE